MQQKILVIFMIFLFFSCEKDKERISVLGSWNCEEHSDIDVVRRYQVNVVQDPVKTDFYQIYNFHNMGQGEENIVLCKKNKETGNLEIDNYSIGSVFINKGIGIVADDFSYINWTYEFTSVNGLKANVTARYY